MAIFIPTPPAEHSKRAEPQWEEYVAELRTTLRDDLRPSEAKAVRFQLELAETLLNYMRMWKPAAAASKDPA